MAKNAKKHENMPGTGPKYGNIAAANAASSVTVPEPEENTRAPIMEPEPGPEPAPEPGLEPPPEP